MGEGSKIFEIRLLTLYARRNRNGKVNFPASNPSFSTRPDYLDSIDFNFSAVFARIALISFLFKSSEYFCVIS